MAKNLTYENELESEVLIELIENKIRPDLKDPDSLKYLKITSKYKCYASNMDVSDNISPKFDYGYWCYDLSYNAKNSYGAYVQGSDFLIYYNGALFSANQLGETVRKSDDVWVSHSPQN